MARPLGRRLGRPSPGGLGRRLALPSGLLRRLPLSAALGGAVAAGLVGGLALGALATAPYYGYGYPYRRAYYAPVAYGGDCWVERRVRINRFGERIVRRVQICG